LLAATFGLNALHAGLWLHIQHTDKSIRKVESMLTKDPGTYYVAKLPSMINLVMLYRANNLWPEAERAAFKACDNYNIMAGCVCYASVLAEQKKRDQAARFFEDLLQRSVFVPEAYMFLLEYYETGKQPEKMAKYLNMLYDAFIIQPDFFMAKIKAPVYQNMFSYLYNIEAPKQDQKRLANIAATIQRLSTLTPQPKK
jgi:hypothetical protein